MRKHSSKTIQCTALFLFAASSLAVQGALALVVTYPGRSNNASPQTNGWSISDRRSRTREVANFILRKTTKDDVQQISSLLASASVGDYGQSGPLNWNSKMQKLRAESMYIKQLSQRIDVLEAGKIAARNARDALAEAGILSGVEPDIEASPISSSINNHPDGVRLIWSDDAFRHKLQRAVTNIEAERHLWHGHNFACAPEDGSLLQHLMLTVIDKSTGEVAGFCEVAMLPLPDDSDAPYAPMIANLVTSPEYRRKGIASRLLKTSNRYVRSCWGSHEQIGLYVEKSNSSAKALYSREGFVEGGVCSDMPSRLYLQKSLRQATCAL